jgi:CBS domain-containing protein
MSTTIKQVLKATPITVRADDDLALVLQVMLWGDIRHLPVLRDDQLVGVLSERDVLRRLAEVGRAVAVREKASAVMSSPPVTIAPDDRVAAAVTLVTERGIGCLPVVEGGRVVGLITRRDLLERQLEPLEPGELGNEELVAERGRMGEPRPAWTKLRVDDVMSREPVTAVADDSIRVAIDRMGRHGVRHLPVIDVERRVIGMLSDRDVRTAVGNPMRAIDSREAAVRIESTRVAHAMSRAPLTLAAGTRLARAATLFADHKVGAVPIVDEKERLVGLVSYTDVLRAVVGPKSNAS